MMVNRDDRNYYEIQLDNKQLIFIFLIAIVICAVFFLIGVKVGKNAKELKYSLASTDSPEEIQTSLPTAEKEEKEKEAPQQPENFAFHQLPEESPKEVEFKPQPQIKEEAKQKVSEKQPPVTKPDTSKEETKKQEVLTDVRYSVQVMSTSFREKALDLRKKLEDKKYPAFIRQVIDSQGKVIYKVRVGSFSDKAKAREMLQKLKVQEKIVDAWISQDKP